MLICLLSVAALEIKTAELSNCDSDWPTNPKILTIKSMPNHDLKINVYEHIKTLQISLQHQKTAKSLNVHKKVTG